MKSFVDKHARVLDPSILQGGNICFCWQCLVGTNIVRLKIDRILHVHLVFLLWQLPFYREVHPNGRAVGKVRLYEGLIQ